MPKEKVVVLCGPTGIGKTALALDLACLFEGQIVSADSMQIYRYLDIGTAKPSRAEQQQVPHHMIDIIDPDDDYSAGAYAAQAGEIIDGLHQDGCLPFLVGGTGLYIKACLHGLFRQKSADQTVLTALTQAAEAVGTPVLYERLKVIDPLSAQRINPQDTFRIVRALEVYETTGQTASALRQAHQFSEQRYQTVKFCLQAERQTIYDRIDRRVDEMMARGLADEVADLLARGYGDELKSLQSLGYRHMIQYLQGRWSWEEMVGTMKRDTRRYAKRQLTWFKSDPDLIWVSPAAGRAEMRATIERFQNNEAG